MCSGTNPRQIQAIADEVELRLEKPGQHPTHIEGYKQAEWVLLDYVDFVVHVFSEKARKFYDLERCGSRLSDCSPRNWQRPNEPQYEASQKSALEKPATDSRISRIIKKSRKRRAYSRKCVPSGFNLFMLKSEMKLRIAWIGKTKEPAIQSLTDEYLKRLSRYADVQGTALKEHPRA